ncbi:hypothetical protein JW826_01810 [Candidatus Woesearchaeota archaeon]|nr:hypothetical protein [Candidatus Woesearchaeota archaeon]
MALTKEEIGKLREAFTTCTRPVILFDNDPDGISSFLMIYNQVKDGKGIPIKSAPEISVEFARSVKDYSPDLVIILDMPMVSQEFLDEINTRIIWLDHHQVMKRKKVEYYNPRIHDPDDNMPTSYWVYKALGGPLWIAMCGIVGDWFLPEKEVLLEFKEKYPDLMPSDVDKPEVALHDTEIGRLSRILSFNLKGKTVDTIKSVKVLTRIKTPYEILKQETPGGRFIYKKYQGLAEEFETLIKRVKIRPEDQMVLFIYQGSSVSFTKELSNELLYRNPDKLILIAWEYNGEYKCSLRTTKHDLPKMIEKALEGGVRGYGGGHAHASGACINKDDFATFVDNMKKQL